MENLDIQLFFDLIKSDEKLKNSFLSNFQNFINNFEHSKEITEPLQLSINNKLLNYPTIVPPLKFDQQVINLIENLIAEYEINTFNNQKIKDSKNKKVINLNIDLNDLCKKHIIWVDDENYCILKDECENKENKENKEKTNKLINYLKILQQEKPILDIDNMNIFSTLYEKAPNFSEVINFYKGSFILNQSRKQEENFYNVPTPILLLGDPGIGKTYFAKLLAKVLGTSFNFLDANSITASWVLTGSSAQWNGSDAGSIFKFMLNSKTVSPVIIFDEIDKLSHGKNYDPFSVFHQLLEPENSQNFKDEFLNISFNASKIIYILTANDIHSIPDSLLSRMRVFDIQKADITSTRLIAQNIYGEIIGKSKLFNPKLEENNLSKLETLSPRDIKKFLNYAIYTQAAENKTENLELIMNIDKKNTKWGFKH